MFTNDELAFIANLINAAIPSAVNNAVDVQNVNHILTKIGEALVPKEEPVEDEDEDGEDVSPGS